MRSTATPQSEQAMKLKPTLLIIATLLSPLSLTSQEPARDPFLLWMNDIAQQQLDQREKAIAAIHTVPEATKRQQLVREKILAAMGGLPDYKGPLNARIMGHIKTSS